MSKISSTRLTMNPIS